VATTAHSCLDMRVTLKHAVSLQTLGAEITIVANDAPGAKALPGMRFVTFEGGSNLRGRAKGYLALRRLLATIPTDVYQCHEPETALAALKVARKNGARVTFDSHEFWGANLKIRIGGLRGFLVGWAIEKLVHRVGTQADYVTVVSPKMKEQYEAMRSDGRVEIIYNSPRPENFPQADQSDRGELLVVHEGMIFINRGLS
jgi:glycosyltransferase involved in cell wall biosynthesis